MLLSTRRRALVAGALALLFVIPLPVLSETKIAEPLSMQVAKRGDEKVTQTIETDHFSVTFSEQGARILEFKNKDKAYPRRDGANIVIPGTEIFLAPYLGATGTAQYVGGNLGAMMYAAFSFSKEETQDTVKIKASAPVVLVADKNKIDATFIKEFVFLKRSPYFKFSVEIQSNSSVKLQNLMLYALPMIGPKPENQGNFRDYHHYTDQGKVEFAYAGGGGGFGCGGSTTSEKISKGPTDFFGSSSRFLILNMQPLFATRSASITPEQRNADTKQLLQAQALHVNMGDIIVEKSKPARFEFIGYMGPKFDENTFPNDDARKVMPDLGKFNKNYFSKSFDFGITEPIRDIIVSALTLLYKLIPNYGVGIILIALLLKLAFFPLNQKQAEAMKRMGELQPKIKELNEKYKNNPQEKQRRMMELYKVHKVNPVSGCLPMLIQLPVFIAMYSAFSDAYDLWKSPFIPGWIPDLSQPDHVFSLPATWPYVGGFAVHLLPVVMTLSQYFQTKLTPTSGDENQRKIMLLMPFMMLFLFYAMPSGVVLYWTVQNALSIAQQVYTNKKNAKAAVKA
ncbi:MAG: membrane protein insertase YidC [Spirochaetes bacterium]|nr:membrane protein insertase YidC [Spirochaetota bacterium]